MAQYLISISTLPASGHINPAFPVAAALVDRGHHVWWHTATEYAAQVKETGARFVALRAHAEFRTDPRSP